MRRFGRKERDDRMGEEGREERKIHQRRKKRRGGLDINERMLMPTRIE